MPKSKNVPKSGLRVSKKNIIMAA